uniref:CAP domain-containing protein (inferred by orthology to a zebrafish protein) n=1 Tax=Strongyloides venezuelensis TaxID=75913 RepID=A0A0K0FCZ6_STRVS
MEFYILSIMLFNTLLSMLPPPLPKKTKIYGEIGTPPPLPPRDQTSVKKNIPPPLPLKRSRYNKKGHKINGKYQSKEYHRVRSYIVRGMILYECNHITFLNQMEAKRYCRIINNNKRSSNRKYPWENTPIIANPRNSFSQPNNDLTNRKKSISGSDNYLTRRKTSLSVSRNSLSGLRKSSSNQSLNKSKSNLLSRKKDVSRSNNNLSSRINSMSVSISDLFGRKSSSRRSQTNSKDDLLSRNKDVSRLNNSLSLRKNAISVSIGNLLGRSSLSERKNFLSRLKKNFNISVIYYRISEMIHIKTMKNKPKDHMIWLKVWKGCNVNCYSKDHNDVYKGLASLEINMYRFLHRVKHLKLSSYLGVIAQELAEEYAIRQKVDLNLYPSYGILYDKSSIASASTIVKSWYERSRKYNFMFGIPTSKSALSFTQIVWKSTTELGIGVKVDNGNLFLVCVFYPKGNQKGKFKRNVYKLTNKNF